MEIVGGHILFALDRSYPHSPPTCHGFFFFFAFSFFMNPTPLPFWGDDVGGVATYDLDKAEFVSPKMPRGNPYLETPQL